MSERCPLCGHDVDWVEPRLIDGLLINERGWLQLGPVEESIVRALQRRPYRGEALVEQVYSQAPDGGPDGAIQSLRSIISRLNKKLRPRLGWEIDTIGAAYVLHPAPEPVTLQRGDLTLQGRRLSCGDRAIVLTQPRARLAAALLRKAWVTLADIRASVAKPDSAPERPARTRDRMDILQPDLEQLGWTIECEGGLERDADGYVFARRYRIAPLEDVET
jgi:hypothetical protein